jgi:outer membrane assembly lipoprotein YfiO
MRLLHNIVLTSRAARRRDQKRSISSVALVALALLQTGCWGSSDVEPEPEAKELKTSKDPLSTEAPEAELVQLSKKLYQVGMYTVARDSLASLKDRYPLGAYAYFAELKHADSFFFNREYNEAAKAYESIIKNYPGSADLPYVKLQAARAHIASARDAGRDRQPWERGLAIYDEIVAEYPGSAFFDIARLERADVVRELAAYDRDIIEFYRRQGNQPAVEAREKQFSDRWETRLEGTDDTSTQGASTATGRPLKHLGLAELTVAELGPIPTAPDQLSATVDEAPSDSAPLPEGAIAIQSVQCRTDGMPFATIEVSRLPESLVGATEFSALTPTNGLIRIEDLGLTARQVAWDCFGVQDLTLSPDGDLLLQTERSFTISTLSEPPRLLLTAGK